MTIALVLMAWLGLAAVFLGLGLVASRALRGTGASLSRTFWIGWVASLALLQAYCLVLPVDGRASIVVAIVSAAGWVACRRERAALWASARTRLWWLPAIGLASIWLADRGLQPPMNGDSLMYHLPAVWWAEAYRVVPGLGNLHGRLAFNNASTLYQAMLDHGPFDGAGFHLAHGLLVLPLFARGLPAASRLLRGRTCSARDIVDAVLLAAATDLTLGPNMPSASPDLPAYVLEAVIASELIGWLEDEAPESTVSMLAFLLAALLAVKLSTIGFVVGGAAVTLIVRHRVPLRAVVGALCVMVPWTIRGAILSGYPAYPSTLGPLPVDWRIPVGAAHVESDVILSWGRRSGVAGWGWVEPWLESIWLENREVMIPLALGIVASIVALANHRRPRLWLLMLPPMAELAWWFATSPDPRFAGATFWLLAAIPLAVAGAGRAAMPATALGLLATVLAVWPVVEAPSRAWIHAGGFQSIAPMRPSRQVPLPSGLTVSVPQSPGECGRILLCTPAPNDALRLRYPGDLGAGFRVGE